MEVDFKKDSHQNKVALLLTLAIFIFYCWHALYLDGSYGGGDGIRHYLVSKWSWLHPDLLLYHWGKPFFTLVTSVFSQFGLIGIKLFNAAIGAISSFLCYKISRRLGSSHPLATLVLASFSPVYVLCINSGLTEPMFVFMLIWVTYLFLEEKYLLSTVLLSFLPFVRSEGNLMFPLFALALILCKKWKLIPFLAFGTVAYSIIGYFHYHDIFWIQTKNPYNGSNFDIYGKGELFHFVKAYKLILGLPLTILFIAGAIYMIVRIFRSKFEFAHNRILAVEILLIYGPFFTYFIAHSIFWWKGLFGSLGLERSIAGVLPLAGIIGGRGLEWILKPIGFNKLIQKSIVYLILLWLVIYPFYTKYLPFELNEEEKLVKQAAEWYSGSEYKNEKVFYLYPYFMHKLNLDAFDGNRVGELWGLYPAIKEWGVDVVPLNTIILWDAHFGANEAYIPLDTMLMDPNFQLVKSFKPEVPFTTLGGYNFEIHAFKRIKARELIKSSEFEFDFEKPTGMLTNLHLVNEGTAYSANHAVHMKKADEFGVTFDHALENFVNFNKIAKVDISFMVFSNEPLKDLLTVLTIDESGKSVQWNGTQVEYSEVGKWKEVKLTFTLNPASLTGANRLKIYNWNRGGNEVYFDNFKIQMLTKE